MLIYRDIGVKVKIRINVPVRVNPVQISQRRFIVLYADDILIFAPSLQELQSIVNICEQQLLSIDMAVNVKKSCTMRIGPRHAVKCSLAILV